MMTSGTNFNTLKKNNMKTIAQQLGIIDFPFIIKDKNNRQVYYEDSSGFWNKREFVNDKEVYYEDSSGQWSKREFDNNKQIYFENSEGQLIDNRNIPEYTMEELVKKLGNFKIKK